MILSELYQLYGRLVDEGVPLPAIGSSLQKMSFLIKITPEGELLGIEDYRETTTEVKQTKKGTVEKKKLISRVVLVPGESKPTGSGVNPCFLWDNAAYLLGYCDPAKGEKSMQRALEAFEGTKRAYARLEPILHHEAFSAACRFLERWQPGQMAGVNPDILEANGSFVIIAPGGRRLLYAQKDLQQWWNDGGKEIWKGAAASPDAKASPKAKAEQQAMCLITGQRAPLAVLHEPAIKGVVNAQSTGAKLVSFNCKSFESYGKEQSANSPVSQYAAFAYCNALNYLLSRRASRLRLGDATVVFWADAPADMRQEAELFLGCTMDDLIEETPGQDEALLQRVKECLEAMSQGRTPKGIMNLEEDTRFCILGLSPNAARLSVRFFHESSFGELWEHLTAHGAAMRLQKRNAKFNDPDYITPRRILRETAREADEIPPSYSGALMRSILLNLPYPDSIAMAIIRRFHADRQINYIRCAYLKAWLTRNHPPKPIQPMLDTTNTNIGYLTGRLFAALQKTQEDALGNINRTLRDSFYASASVNPRNVFPRLMKLYPHHLAKLPAKGAQVKRDKLVQEIMDSITEFPARLSLQQQGYFALGYYQQTQDFYKTKTPEE